MPMNRSAYPPDWDAISLELRNNRAQQRCECTGQCGLHQPNPSARRCIEMNHQSGRWLRGRVVLTVAHTCDCYPLCSDRTHLLAMCQRCHLRFDRFRHAASRLRTQASPTYKAKRYSHAAARGGFEALRELERCPKRKRNRLWFPPPVMPGSSNPA
jgi:hypothetical protein